MLDCVAFCASHITTEQRYKLLLGTLKSINEQTYKIPFHLSVYATNPICIPGSDEFINVHIQPKPLSQFEHFCYLVNTTIQDLEKTFCIFCDDDDFSHPRRFLFYATGVDQGQMSLLACDSVLLINEDRNTLEQCERLLEEKGAEIINGHEYFMFCVRASVLKQFCEILRKYKCLNSPYCDILFNAVLFHANKLWRTSHWLYAYSVRPGRDRDKEIEDYKTLLNIPGLLDELEKTFKIEKWTHEIRGFTDIYGDYFAKENQQKQSTTRKARKKKAGNR